MQVVIIGAGAAGCFASIELKRRCPHCTVIVVEALGRSLAKVAITGGGRCNLTNSFAAVNSLEQVYPRGARLMKRLFRIFSPADAYAWFEREGVQLVTQADECVFPKSQDAQQVVHTLRGLMQQLGVRVLLNHAVSQVQALEGAAEAPRYRIHFKNSQQAALEADAVIVTTGGSPRQSGLSFLQSLPLSIVPPVPSLFSVCLPQHRITALMGTVVDDVSIALAGTKLRTTGPLLVTHWGLSGPAILKLSAHAARALSEANYQARITINWCGSQRETEVVEQLQHYAQHYAARQLQRAYPTHLNNRLWCFLLEESGLQPDKRWGEVGKKQLNRLAATLTNHVFEVNGKNRFKEEFVTCGGIALSSLNAHTLEAREQPGLYFAGEVTDVDAVTGGFNLQAAWTMGYVVAQALSQSLA